MSLSTIIADKQHIAIFGHTNIDGDCLGSMLSLGGILEQLGKQVDYIADDFPTSRNRIPGIEKISSDLDTSKTYDLRIGVDFSPWHRTGQLYRDHQSYFDQIQDNLLIIDHHIEDNYHATRNIKDSDADANCVWLYELFVKAGREQYITPQVATYLLMGIITDTARYIFDEQPGRVLDASAQLISRGADKPHLIHHLYHNTDPSVLQILQSVLQNYRIQDNILLVSRDERETGKLSKAERDVIYNIMQGISGYKIALFAVVKDEHQIKLSLRSKQAHEVIGNIVSCDQLAQQHFNGGGHTHAAGGIYRHNQKTNEALQTIFDTTLQYIK